MADKNYEKLLAYARAKDLVHDTRHIDGWKDTKNAEIRRLYVAGKVSPERGIAAKATAKDHIAAIKGGLDPLKLAELGVDLRKLSAVEARMLGEKKAAPVREAKAREAAAPKTMLVIKSATVKEVAVKATVGKAKLTHTQLEAAQAVAYAEKARAAKDAQAAKDAEGKSVTLSAQEVKALIQAHTNKGAKIVIR